MRAAELYFAALMYMTIYGVRKMLNGSAKRGKK